MSRLAYCLLLRPASQQVINLSTWKDLVGGQQAGGPTIVNKLFHILNICIFVYFFVFRKMYLVVGQQGAQTIVDLLNNC